MNKWGKLSPHPDGLASTPPAPEPDRVNRENNKSAGTWFVCGFVWMWGLGVFHHLGIEYSFIPNTF